MAVNRVQSRAVGLLLLLLLLGAQFHFLSDWNSGQPGTHLCPLCSLLSFAVLLALPILCCLPVMGRTDHALSIAVLTPGSFRATSPRAPPTL